MFLDLFCLPSCFCWMWKLILHRAVRFSKDSCWKIWWFGSKQCVFHAVSLVSVGEIFFRSLMTFQLIVLNVEFNFASSKTNQTVNTSRRTNFYQAYQQKSVKNTVFWRKSPYFPKAIPLKLEPFNAEFNSASNKHTRRTGSETQYFDPNPLFFSRSSV